MLNEPSKTYLFMHYVTDLLLICLSWFLATYIRFRLIDFNLEHYYKFLRLFPIPIIVGAIFLLRDRYGSRHILQAWHREFSQLLILNVNILIVFILTGYNIQSDRLSRLTLIMFFLISTFFLIVNRIIFRNHIQANMIKGKYKNSLLLIGHGSHVDRFVNKVKDNFQTGMFICGWADSEGEAEKMGIPSFSYEDIDKKVEELHPQSIVIGYTGKEVKKQETFIKTHYNQVTPIILIPQMNYSLIGTSIEDVLGVPLMFINKPRENTVMLTAKRILDIIGSLSGLIILSPLLTLIALLVKATSPGPVFYGQERMTKEGRVFKMWKFRSMRQDADKEEGFTWTVEDDPRRTKFGTFIRQTSLDEFPQLWNVLKGDMSLVGPRPERPELIENFKNEIPGYMLRHKMRAGITGWAQINGWRGNTSLEKRIEFDMYYIRNWKFTLDIKILFLTVFNGFVNKNAY